jgi:cyclophilin family peptidyl-prolyl cis-trans isomerase
MKRAFAVLTLVAVFPLFAIAQQKEMKWDKPPEMQIDTNKQYFATIETSKGKIVLELFPKEAPQTVNSFVFLAKQGFYDGVEFHRVIPGFMIQTGDRNGNPPGTGDAGYKFDNENQNTTRTYKEGTVGMANSGPNTNGSQFFVMDKDNPLPAANYTIFGQVTEGQDVVHAIATVKTIDPAAHNDRPVEKVVMTKVTIEEK